MSRFIAKLKAKLAMALSNAENSATIFSDIYRKKLWSVGDARNEMFWSGTGSTEEFTSEYARIIAAFIARHQISSVVDLGCGDFQVAKRILGLTGFRYFGVDVVPDLVSRNNKEFGNEDIRFLQADIARDELPDGDLCLIRQVLQHLDNATITKVLDNVSKYRWIIITESQQIDCKEANLDIKPGPWTRTLFNSGIYLDRPPFSREIETLLEVKRNDDVIICTWLLKS